jgi:hypothetical protein
MIHDVEFLSMYLFAIYKSFLIRNPLIPLVIFNSIVYFLTVEF